MSTEAYDDAVPYTAKDYSRVICGGLGCLTDDCEHWAKTCSPLKGTRCVLPGIDVQEISKAS